MKAIIGIIFFSLHQFVSFSQVPTLGLMHYYPFNNNTLDYVGVLHGVSVGTALYGADRFGNLNACYDVIDQTNHINLPAAVVVHDDYTISAWVKVKQIMQWPRLYDFANGYLIDNVIGKLSHNWNSCPAMQYYITSSSFTDFITTNPLSINLWYHIVYIQNGTTMEVYVNSISIGTYTSTIPPQNVVRTSNKIGGSNAPLNDPTKAYIDDFRIYDRCITSAEVHSLYIENHSNLNVSLCAGEFYTLSNGTSISSSGIYYDTLTNSAGLDSIVTINLTINNVYNITINASICSGSSFQLPSGSTVNISGNYIDSFLTTHGCDSIITTILTVNSVNTKIVYDTICSNQNFTLPNGVSVNANGSYLCSFQNNFGCDSSITVNLFVYPSFDKFVNKFICKGDVFTLPSGIQVSSNGTYQSSFVSSKGCDSIITIQLSVSDQLYSTISEIICSNQIYTLPNGTITNQEGVYIDTIQSSFGCDSIIQTTIHIVHKPTLYLGNDTTFCNGSSIILNISTPNATYWWSDNYTQPIRYLQEAGVYIAEIMLPPCDAVRDTLKIDICSNCTVFIPNAFSPNNDMKNDIFKPLFSCVLSFENYLIKIYNRWGELIFYSTIENDGWDGTFKGSKVDVGTYLYFVKYIDPETKRENILKGDILLIR